MSTTVLAPSGFEISSNHEDAESMLGSLATEKAETKTPRVLVKGGQPVKDDGEKDETAKAASVLGKKGGEAAAEARKLKAKSGAKDPKGPSVELDEAALKDAKDRADEKATKGKTEEADSAEEKDADGKPLGKPRNDPRARIQQLAHERDEQKRRADAAEARATAAERAKTAPAEAKPAAVRTDATATRQAPQNDPKPDLSTYEGEDAYERFVEDTGRWAARDENRKVQTQQAHEAAHREWAKGVQTHVDTFHERVTGLKQGDAGQGKAFAEFMATLPDAILAPSSVQLMAHAAKTNQPDLRPGPENLMADLILKSNKPREIFEHFAENVDDYQRIAALQDPSGDPRQTAVLIQVEMAILSHRLDAVTADTSSEREVSRAGSPGRSVPGSPRAVDPDLSNADFESHMRRKAAARK